MEETVTLEIPKQYIQIIYQALVSTCDAKQVGIKGAEALVVVAKEIAKQSGEEPPAPEVVPDPEVDPSE